jgi:hypothetical protein
MGMTDKQSPFSAPRQDSPPESRTTPIDSRGIISPMLGASTLSMANIQISEWKWCQMPSKVVLKNYKYIPCNVFDDKV